MDLSWQSAHDIEIYIPLDQCKDGFLYHIAARNATLGINRAKDKGFEIRREKFGNIFSFIEDHWDTGEPYGTVKPLREIEQTPNFPDEADFITYMEEKFKELSKDEK
jgi:hypothetical protein